MRRRRFLELLAGGAAVGLGALGCAGQVGDGEVAHPAADAGDGAADASAAALDGGAPDARAGCDAQTVLLYDTYAQALYLDGSYGPLTGVITAAAMRDGVRLDMDFWHGHGGQLHAFTVTAAHFEALRRGEKVTLETTVVDDHKHTLFIDPGDPDYRVPDTEPVPVTLGDC